MSSCVSIYNFTNGLGHPYMDIGKNHIIKQTPNDVNFCDAISVSCDNTDWVKSSRALSPNHYDFALFAQGGQRLAV